MFLAPGGFRGLDFPLRLVAARQLAAFGLQIAFLDVLARLKHVVIESGHGTLDEVVGSASARGGEVQQLLFRAGGTIHFRALRLLLSEYANNGPIHTSHDSNGNISGQPLPNGRGSVTRKTEPRPRGSGCSFSGRSSEGGGAQFAPRPPRPPAGVGSGKSLRGSLSGRVAALYTNTASMIAICSMSACWMRSYTSMLEWWVRVS